MSPFGIAILSFASGLAVGVFVALNLRSGKEKAALKEQLQTLQEEFDTYKTNVGKHFVETSTLINNLTQSYKEVHQHLSKGAQTLCPEDLALELQRNTVPLIRDAIEADAQPAEHPGEPPQEMAAAEPLQSDVSGAGSPEPESMAQSPADAVASDPEASAEPKREASPVAAGPAAEHPAEASKEPPAASEAETANLEEIMRHAQGASGQARESDNLADIARHAEGASLDDEALKQETTSVSPEEIPEMPPEPAGAEQEKNGKT